MHALALATALLHASPGRLSLRRRKLLDISVDLLLDICVDLLARTE